MQPWTNQISACQDLDQSEACKLSSPKSTHTNISTACQDKVDTQPGPVKTCWGLDFKYFCLFATGNSRWMLSKKQDLLMNTTKLCYSVILLQYSQNSPVIEFPNKVVFRISRILDNRYYSLGYRVYLTVLLLKQKPHFYIYPVIPWSLLGSNQGIPNLSWKQATDDD